MGKLLSIVFRNVYGVSWSWNMRLKKDIATVSYFQDHDRLFIDFS
jgi:hypothetical protein